MGATARSIRKHPRALGSSPVMSPWVQRGRVTGLAGDRGIRATVGCDEAVEATVAVAGGYVPRAGDTVLLATGETGERYVVGVLDAPRSVSTSVSTSERVPGGETARVTDNTGRLVFEHFPAEGRSVVHAPAGDLEFRADHGSITLTASDTVTVHGAHTVDLRGDRAVTLGTLAVPGLPGSNVTLDARGTTVTTPVLDVRATRVEVAAEEARLVARAVTTTAETVRHVAGVIETQATRVVTRVKNAYHEVEELSQTRAGRLRVIAQGTFHLLGERVFFKAVQDIKLKGEKIHLG